MPELLDKGWRTWRFDQIAVMVNDRIDDPSKAGVDRYVGLEHLDSGSLTIRRWGAPSDVEATKLRFRAGDIIFGRRRVYQRKLGVPDFDGICSAHAMVLRARSEVASPEFLPFFMQSDLFMERAKQISVGSLSPTINWKALAQEEFTLPPLDEQRRMADVLGAAQSTGEAYSIVGHASATLSTSYAAEVLRKHANAQTTVGAVSKFTSGQQIRATDLPKRPSEASPIPVYGGNGISGYTDKPMEDCHTPTIVVGRVGQFCGVTTLTTGPAWITDNALYPEELADDVDMAFLAMCLRASDINRGKLGEYLPLVTQKVVHAVRIPKVPKKVQVQYALTFGRIESGCESIRQRKAAAVELKRNLLTQLISIEAR